METIPDDCTLEDIQKLYENGTHVAEVYSAKILTMKSLCELLDKEKIEGYIPLATRMTDNKISLYFEQDCYLQEFLKKIPKSLELNKALPVMIHTLFISRFPTEQLKVAEAVQTTKTFQISDSVESKNHLIIHFNEYTEYLKALQAQY